MYSGGHILRNCLLKHVIEGQIEGRITTRQRRRRKQLLAAPKETGIYWKLKEEELDHIRWRTRFRRGC
jgi:hypothetical protein